MTTAPRAAGKARPKARRPSLVVRNEKASRFRWTPELVKLLGKMSDEAVTKRSGASRTAVRGERRRRGVPAFRPRREAIRWTPAMLRQLGTESDRRIAAELGIPRSSVKQKRQLLGIAPCHPPPHQATAIHWTPEDEAWLGKMSDRRAAEALGISRVAVTVRRRILGIPAFGRQPVKIHWTRKRIAALGRRTDREIAEWLGVSKASVTRKRLELGIPASSESRPVVVTRELRRILRLPPSIARKKTGLKLDTIKKLRETLGIEAPRLIDVPWTKAALAKLGKLPDGALAAELGVDLSAVRGRRLKLGIPSSRPWKRWSQREVELLRSSLSDEEIARRVKRKPHSVRAKRRTLPQL